jgi:hypothetical protein
MSSERTEFACGLALILAVSAVIGVVLHSWADCGKACGAADKRAQTTDRPRGSR